MIFKQYQEIARQEKTQTRRVVKENEQGDWIQPDSTYDAVFTRSMPMPPKYAPVDRLKWAVGRDYAVVPKRGWRTVKYNPSTGETYNPVGGEIMPGFRPLRVRITRIRQERLQAITHEDALAEGVGSIDAYRELWDSINKTKGLRWADDPLVWVLEFERVLS